MAYITDYTYASDDVDVSSHTGMLPTYDVGDLLVWLVAKDSSTGSHLVLPSGWTSIYDNSLKNEMLACYKFAQSGETAPQTSSSDADAYQSSMYCIKGADQSTPISAISAIANADAAIYTTYTYLNPSNTASGNLHFAFANPSGVGGISIENFGKRYINDETTSMASAVHINTITDVNNVPSILGTSQHTSTGMLQFEIIDDGNNLSKPVCYNDLDIIELATDDMVNGSTLGNSTLTTLDGLSVVAGTITNNGGDIGFYPQQKAPYMKGVKGLEYTSMELLLSASVDLSTDLFAVSVYPYKPKYQPTIGIGTQGRFVYLMDANGNYKAFNIDSADNKLLNFAMQFTYILDPQSTPFASSGTLDLTAVTKIGFGERSRTIICYMAFNRLYRYRNSTIKGGCSTLKASFSTLLDYQDGSYYRPNLLQGQDILVQVPIEIGDGVVNTYFYDKDKIIEYPANYSVVDREYLFHQQPNRSGVNFNLTTNSVVDLENMVLQGSSQWYFTSSNSNGTITINNSTIKGAGVISLTDNMSFNNCKFIDNSVVSGSINIINSSISVPRNTYGIDVTNITNFKNISFSDFSGKYAIYVPASITTITLDNIISDGSGTDVYWAGTSGTLTVSLTNGSNLSTSASGGGTVNIVGSIPVTVTALDKDTGLGIPDAHVTLLRSDTKATIISDGNTDANGVYSTSIDSAYSGVDYVGWVRQSDLIGNDYVAVDVQGTFGTNGADVTVSMIRE